MVTYALLTRMHPFESEPNSTDTISAQRILELITTEHVSPSPLRPSTTAVAHCDKRLVHLMERCWSEAPHERPAFHDIVQQLSALSKVKGSGGGSVTDQLLRRLERYASDMESLVAERTRELENEQRRSDELLNRMLPQQIASELKKHGQVQPESFDNVTIYFRYLLMTLFWS